MTIVPARIRMPKFGEFVAIIAVMMGLTALSIDNLLPAFPAIQATFGIADANQVQYLVYVYMLGFGVMQLAYGPISDMIGRRPTLTIGLVLYALGCLLAAVAPSFQILLAARVIQGMGVAACRVLAVAIVRDCYSGREMARVMSLTFAVFIIVPVFAPAMGSVVLAFGTWHLLFAIMLMLGVVVAVWFGLRMPETLHPEYRLPFSAGRILDGVRTTVTTRVAIGYSTAVGLMFACIMAYVGSAQQIFETEVYGLGSWFPLVFGLIAAVMGVASVLNSTLVRRLGMRRLSHAGVLGYLAASLVQVLVGYAYDGVPPLLVFGSILAVNQFLASLTLSNFNAMAMEPLGAIAGTASSFTGFYTTLIGAVLGGIVGQAFDGTVLPLAIGYLSFSILTVFAVLWTENWRLFRPHHHDPGPLTRQPGPASDSGLDGTAGASRRTEDRPPAL
jgi:DHA1 family bicyclomycin/chloramphenicol resistance-like MFS transporter